MKTVGYLGVVNALTAGYVSLALIRNPQVSTGTYLASLVQ
jgi:succinate-acetate transporter protein